LSETTRKQVLCWAFYFHFRALWAPQNGTKEVLEGQQVGGTYGPMSELKNKPPYKIIRVFHLGEVVRNNQKTGFYAVLFFIMGPFGHPQMN
jgi:hypothetical protein